MFASTERLGVTKFVIAWNRSFHSQPRARTSFVTCRRGRLTARRPASPYRCRRHWWLRTGSNPIAVKVAADSKKRPMHVPHCHRHFACNAAKPEKGTIKRGTAVSLWTGEAIDGDYIKTEAQAGRMGQQLYAVGTKQHGDFSFREPTPDDEVAYQQAVKRLGKCRPAWEAADLIPPGTPPRRPRRLVL